MPCNFIYYILEKAFGSKYLLLSQSAFLLVLGYFQVLLYSHLNFAKLYKASFSMVD